jgi:hypothetical protein
MKEVSPRARLASSSARMDGDACFHVLVGRPSMSTTSISNNDPAAVSCECTSAIDSGAGGGVVSLVIQVSFASASFRHSCIACDGPRPREFTD